MAAEPVRDHEKTLLRSNMEGVLIARTHQADIRDATAIISLGDNDPAGAGIGPIAKPHSLAS